MDKLIVKARIAGLFPSDDKQFPSTGDFAAQGLAVELRKRLLQNRKNVSANGTLAVTGYPISMPYGEVEVEVQSVSNDDEEHVTITLPDSITSGMTTQEYENHRYYVEDTLLEVYDEHQFWKTGVVAEIEDAFEFASVKSPFGNFQNLDGFLRKITSVSRHTDNQELVDACIKLQEALNAVNKKLEELL